MDTLRFIWGLTILICISCQVANAQIQGCSLLGVDFEKCMEQDGSSATMESCCKTLNHAVQAESLPIFPTPTTPEPALNFPPARPVPVQLPPDMPEEDLMQPSVPDDIRVPLPPKRAEIPPNPTSTDSNSSVAEGRPIISSDVHPMLFIPEPRYLKSHGGGQFKVLPHPRVLLPVALFVIL